MLIFPTIEVIVPVWVPEGNQIMMDNAQRSLRTIRNWCSHNNAILTVVDNGAELDRELMGYADKYFRLEENQGYAGGVNYGLDHLDPHLLYVGVGSCDVHMLDTSDAILHPLTNRLGIVSPRAKIVRFGNDTGEWEQPDCDYWGGIFFMQYSVAATVGRLDTEHFKLRFSDTDYAVRAAKAGFWVGRSDVVVEHHDPSTSTLLMPDDELQAEWDALFEVHGEFDVYGWRYEQWQ